MDQDPNLATYMNEVHGHVIERENEIREKLGEVLDYQTLGRMFGRGVFGPRYTLKDILDLLTRTARTLDVSEDDLMAVLAENYPDWFEYINRVNI